MKPLDLSLPKKFTDFRSHPGFSQWDIIKQIALLFRDYRFVLLHAPPGAGKTLIATAVQQLLSRLYPLSNGRMLFLTPSRGLQDQLSGEFDSVRVVKGRSNYRCPGFGTCDIPAVSESTCFVEKPGRGIKTQCPYRLAIEAAAESMTPCGNYAFWLSLATYGDPLALGEFDFLVCDEAHSILDTLTDFSSIVLKPEDFRLIDVKLPRYEEIGEWIEWALLTRHVHCQGILDLASKSIPRIKAKLTNLLKSLDIVASIEDEKWVVDTRALDIKLSPKWPGKRSEGLLFRDIERVLLLSGSLTPEVIEDLGIDPQSATFLEIASTSPPANRPVIYLSMSPPIKVDHSMTGGDKRALVRRVDSITDLWQEHKGLILSPGYDLVEVMMNETRYPDLLISHRKGEVRSAIEKYRRQSEGILISPALWEGYDFPECEWLVFLKIPFLPKDPILQARKKERKGFANSVISAKLLQGSMRHIRSHTARGVTFILDWHWTHFQKTGYFPQYYRAAWRVRDTIPTPKECGL